MSNRLAAETSPYLLQHKDNPVDWYPWGDEALERARSEQHGRHVDGRVLDRRLDRHRRSRLHR